MFDIQWKPGFHEDNRGCSLVLVNTKKGRVWLRKVSKDIDYIEVTGYLEKGRS